MKKYYPWVVVALLCVVALLNYLDRQMLSTLKDSMGADFPELSDPATKDVMFGWLMSAFLWVYAFVSPFAGFIADKLSRKWLIIGSLAVWSAVTCLMGYAPNFTWLIVLRGVMGVSEALYIPSALSLIADWHQDGKRSLAVGVHTTGLYIGSALGGFGAMAANGLGGSWQTVFLVLGLIGIGYAFVLMLGLKEKRGRKPVVKPVVKPDVTEKPATKGRSYASGLGMMLGMTAFWAILLMFALPSLPGWATKNWLPELFKDVAGAIGLNPDYCMAYATISLAAASFLGAFIGGFLSDWWIKRNVRGRVYTSAIGLSLTLPGLVLLGFCHGLVPVIGAVLLFGIGFGMFDANNMPILCQFIPSRNRATAYGLMNMIGVLFGALATTLMGLLPSLGFGFAVMAAGVAIAIALQLICLKPKVENME